jgi:hypothetical protein
MPTKLPVASEGNDLPLAVAILIATYPFSQSQPLYSRVFQSARRTQWRGSGGVFSRYWYVQERRLAPT